MAYFLLFSYIVLWTCLILMILSIYRFKLDNYWKHALFSGLVMAPFSVLIHYKAYPMSGTLQVILLLFMMWYVFKIGIVYALTMTISGYILVAIPELIVDWYYERFLEIENVPEVPQIIAIITFILAVIYISTRYRLGFSFVPTHKRGNPVTLKKTNYKIVIVLVLAFIWITVATIISTQEIGFSYVLLTIVIFIVLIAILLKQQYNKDLED